MTGRSRRGGRIEHGTRKWILKVLETSNGATVLPGSEVRKRVAKMSGAQIPDYSVYQALRTLIRQKRVRATRAGRELSYQLVGPASAGTRAAPASSPGTAPGGARRGRPPAHADAQVRGELHKLSMGDIVILKIGDSFVEVATNLNGRLVLERHPRPE